MLRNNAMSEACLAHCNRTQDTAGRVHLFQFCTRLVTYLPVNLVYQYTTPTHAKRF